MSGHFINNTITRIFKEEVVNFVLPHLNFKQSCVYSYVVEIVNHDINEE